jgi:hypothetical protein
MLQGNKKAKKVPTGIRPDTGNGTSVVLAQFSGGKLKSIQPTETPAAKANDLLYSSQDIAASRIGV